MFPAPSISAEGKLGLRRPPACPWLMILEMVTVLLQLWPPSVERNAAMAPPSNGTTTVPLGCTSGWPPRPPAWSTLGLPGPHVCPPSVDVLIRTCPVLAAASH